MKEEISPICQSCHREQHIYLQKPWGENVFVCEDKNGAIKIQNSLHCVEPNCVFCKCSKDAFQKFRLLPVSLN